MRSPSKPGKHGHAEAHIVALDLFTGKKYEDLCPTSHVSKNEYQRLSADKDSGEVHLLTETVETKNDLFLTTALVADTGSSMCNAGFADDAPRALLPLRLSAGPKCQASGSAWTRKTTMLVTLFDSLKPMAAAARCMPPLCRYGIQSWRPGCVFWHQQCQERALVLTDLAPYWSAAFSIVEVRHMDKSNSMFHKINPKPQNHEP